MNHASFLLRLRPFGAAFATLALAGCITVGSSSSGDGGCDSDSDCDDDEICDDGECRPDSGGSGTTSSSCDVFCDWSVPCGFATSSECLPGCQATYSMGGECRTAIDRLSQCLAANLGDCTAIEGACYAQAEALLAACADCPYTNDDECDEPEGTGYCEEGTDVDDCTCPFTNDGDCDEPEGLNLCPEGSDAIDCAGSACVAGSSGNSCFFACDDECDEPEGTDLCTDGTDTYDCTYFP